MKQTSAMSATHAPNLADSMGGVSIPAYYMRGGTSKGVFFAGRDLPMHGPERDAVLLRVIGSPDPYARHTDGMGGATSSTSKVVVISPSQRADCDVDYRFGQVAIGEPLIDWSGNCGNLSAAVGPFALWMGMLAQNGKAVADADGYVSVRIWQENIGQLIIAEVPVQDGWPVESGTFNEDGVPFGGAEIRLQYLEAGSPDAPLALCPTGNASDLLEAVLADGELFQIEATLVTAGNPTVFVRAADLALSGIESQDALDGCPELCARLEAIRAAGAVRMGLAPDAASATSMRPATPKIAWVAPARAYQSSAGKSIGADSIDLVARIMSMGRLHHAFTGTGSIALAAAAALPGSLVQQTLGLGPQADPLSAAASVRIGHPSGVLNVGAKLVQRSGLWIMQAATMKRSARRLMTGLVQIPPAHIP